MQWIVLNTGDFKKFVPWLNQKWRVTSRKIKFCTVPFFWLWCNHLDLIHSTHSCSQENIRRFGNVIFFSNTNYITSFLEKRSNGEWRSRTRIVEGIGCKTQGSVSLRFEFSIERETDKKISLLYQRNWKWNWQRSLWWNYWTKSRWASTQCCPLPKHGILD